MSSLNLAEVAPFDQLQPDQLRALQAQIQLRRCRLGQVLQTLEQPGQGLAQIRAGQVVWGGHQQQLQGLTFRGAARCGLWQRGVSHGGIGCGFGGGTVGLHEGHPMGIWPEPPNLAMTGATNAVRPRAGMS